MTIILAAGRGSRLHPYTANCPKCLTELGGETLIERQIATLRAAGMENIIIATGYRAEMLCLEQTRQVHNARWKTTNMVETLFCAEAAFGQDLIVSYAVIVYEPRVIEALLQSKPDISIVVDRNWRALWEFRFQNPLADAESLRIDDDGHIIEIGQPAASLDEIEAQYIGLMRFRGAGIEALRSAYHSLHTHQRGWMDQRPPEQAYMTDLLSEMIVLGHKLQPVVIDGGWLEIDTVQDYEKIGALFEAGTVGAFFDPTATAGGRN